MWERCCTNIQAVGGVSWVQRKIHKRFGGRVGTQSLWGHLQAKLGSWECPLGLREKQQCCVSPDHEVRGERTPTTTFWRSKWRCVGWLCSKEVNICDTANDWGQDYSLWNRALSWLWVSSRQALWWGIDAPLSWFYCQLFCLTLNKKVM